MPGVVHYLQQGDLVTRGVATILLVMSIATWCLALGKAWMLGSVRRRSLRAVAAFWSAASARAGVEAMRRIDTEGLLLPLAEVAVDASLPDLSGSASAPDAAQALSTVASESLDERAEPSERLMRRLRQALLVGQRRLESGLTLLATMASVAPFVGLLGTVWGIYHALIGIAGSGEPSIADVAGPVGEALIMTAFGLAVAIPAVVAYNLLGRLARARIEELDGFARDLHTFFARGGR
jgi:biopolymer transport protein ExbB